METRWERLSGLTGIAFAVLILAALAVQGVLPNADAPAGPHTSRPPRCDAVAW
jgi:hypothetical protein